MEKVFEGATLIKFRVRKKITQQEVADYLGIHQSTVQKWETGKNGSLPNANQLQQLAKFLEVSVEDFFVNVEINFTPPQTK